MGKCQGRNQGRFNQPARSALRRLTPCLNTSKTAFSCSRALKTVAGKIVLNFFWCKIRWMPVVFHNAHFMEFFSRNLNYTNFNSFFSTKIPFTSSSIFHKPFSRMHTLELNKHVSWTFQVCYPSPTVSHMWQWDARGLSDFCHFMSQNTEAQRQPGSQELHSGHQAGLAQSHCMAFISTLSRLRWSSAFNALVIYTLNSPVLLLCVCWMLTYTCNENCPWKPARSSTFTVVSGWVCSLRTGGAGWLSLRSEGVAVGLC